MNHNNNYRKLAISLTLSFIVMYGVMFLNVDRAEHIYLSMTRAYMALLMVAPMAIIMLLTMKGMYPMKQRNNLITVMSALVFVIALIGLRQQVLISDEQYMRAMIPHHSSAIMTSKHADIKDPEVKALSEQIIASQEKEIALMKEMLERMQ